nr:MBL fold metallo-hydrolase [Chloroflexota bacterium]
MNGDPKTIAACLLASGLTTLILVHCTARPEYSTKPMPTALPTVMKPAEEMRLTIVYDNNAHDTRLRTSWGFACWVQYGETSLLFDTGGDASILLSNMNTLGLDPQDIDIVVLSHIHGDHTGGLMDLLATGARPQVYLPVSFPEQFKSSLRERVTVHEVAKAQEILPGIYTTGEIGTNIREQGLVVGTHQGLVVLTGCAHPGILAMVRQAQAIAGGEIYLVVGGFHLGSASVSTIREICAAFRQWGVKKIAPCHCTGEQAMRIFAIEFEDNYILCGVGQVIDLTP